jgi:hypothetical protein
MANASIRVSKNGPYIVRGEVELLDMKGNKIKVEKESIALCRCGASALEALGPLHLVKVLKSFFTLIAFSRINLQS